MRALTRAADATVRLELQCNLSMRVDHAFSGEGESCQQLRVIRYPRNGCEGRKEKSAFGFNSERRQDRVAGIHPTSAEHRMKHEYYASRRCPIDRVRNLTPTFLTKNDARRE